MFIFFFFFSPLFQTRPLPLGIMCTEITVPKGNISRVTAALAIDDPLRISTNTRSVSEKFQIVISKPLVDCTKGRWGGELVGVRVLLIASTQSVTCLNIHHNYDKITQLNANTQGDGCGKCPTCAV